MLTTPHWLRPPDRQVCRVTWSPGQALTPPQVSLRRTTHMDQVSPGTDLSWILGLVAGVDVAIQLTMSARRLRRARKDIP